MSDSNTPQPQVPPATPEQPAPPASPAPPSAAPPSRWTNLIIAVAIVTVGGYVLGRATRPAPPAPVLPALGAAPRRRIPPDLLRRIRFAPRRGPQVALGTALANMQRPAMTAENGQGPARMPAEPAAAGHALEAVQAKVQSCLSGVPAARAAVVRYRARADGTIDLARMVYPAADAQVHQCVVDAVKGVHVPGLAKDATGTHVFAAR